jgi:hypothetical protein
VSPFSTGFNTSFLTHFFFCFLFFTLTLCFYGGASWERKRERETEREYFCVLFKEDVATAPSQDRNSCGGTGALPIFFLFLYDSLCGAFDKFSPHNSRTCHSSEPLFCHLAGGCQMCLSEKKIHQQL